MAAHDPYAGTVRVFEPVGTPVAFERTLAPRPRSLTGLRPGILENRKANARLLLETIVDGLGERTDLRAPTVRSKNAAAPAKRSLIEQLAREADFVLVGSCD